ncbi:MAG: hypothetical protein GY829_15415, partial [Gammaproteobacteria bacterium]|nr:hypothetical protein [Gammaproteobacteria bacterium]
MKKFSVQLLVLLFITQLASCGGGGGDGGNTPTANVAPTANAGEAQTVDEQTTITLSGSGTDSDGTISSYSWEQTTGTTVSLSNADSATATFDAPVTTEQLTLTFELTVTDNDGATNTDTIIIDIMPVITGLAVDDLLINATVKLLTFPEQQLIVETQTDSDGRYSFQQASLPEYLIIEVTRGTLNGEAFLGTLTGVCLLRERLSCDIT